MFTGRLKTKLSHFFTAEVGGVSPGQIVRAGLTFSAAAGALGVLAGDAGAGGCDPCPRYVCDSDHPDWTCEVDCSARTFGGTWTEVCAGQDCVSAGSGSVGYCQ